MTYFEQLINFLDLKVNETIDKIDPKKLGTINQGGPKLDLLLNAALKNEWETAILSLHWAITEKDFSFSSDLIKLAADENKHFHLIANYCEKNGIPINLQSIHESQKSPFFNHLLKYTTTFERVVLGPFFREYLAVKRNELFLELLDHLNKSELKLIYETIQEDEIHHHKLSKKYLDNILNNEENLEMAKELITHTVSLIDDIHEIMVIQKGLNYLPGC